MPVQYDPTIIQKQADRLYSRAASLAAVYACLGLMAGGVAGGVAGEAFQAMGTGAIICGLFTGGLGLALGIERGFALRLQAQTALCQVKIEEATCGSRQHGRRSSGSWLRGSAVAPVAPALPSPGS